MAAPRSWLSLNIRARISLAMRSSLRNHEQPASKNTLMTATPSACLRISHLPLANALCHPGLMPRAAKKLSGAAGLGGAVRGRVIRKAAARDRSAPPRTAVPAPPPDTAPVPAWRDDPRETSAPGQTARKVRHG